MALPAPDPVAPSPTGETHQSRKAGPHHTKKAAGVPDTDDLVVLWDYFQHTTDFFQAVQIDEQAGFDEISDLWSVTRYAFGAVALLTMGYNTFTILNFNFQLLANDDPALDNIFLISDWTGRSIFGQDMFGDVRPVDVLAYLELAFTAGLFAWAIKNLCGIFVATTKASKWHSVAIFFFSVFPALATLSLVKLLGSITPAVLIPELMWTINKAKTHRTGCIELVWFIGTRLLCLFAGFDAFLYKFQIIAELFTNPEASQTQNVVLTTILFVNQMLGVVQLGTFTKRRIFVFIFAGEDGQMTEKEDAVRATWEAFLCYKTAEMHGVFRALFIWWSFSDADFQKMVLDTKETEGGKASGYAQAGALGALLNG